jgi:thiamine biosynthesis lipoprotein
MVKFKLPGMKVDLGGIAKGYALDCAAKKLRKSGVKSCLINAGGQIYCLGDRFSEPWRIAIKEGEGNTLSTKYLKLKNSCVATSGGYEQYFLKSKKRYAHIFDPRTGYPADSGIVSVSVIASNGLTSDTLATAIFVLGRQEGEKLIKQFNGAEARITEKIK